MACLDCVICSLSCKSDRFCVKLTFLCKMWLVLSDKWNLNLYASDLLLWYRDVFTKLSVHKLRKVKA